MGLSAIECIHRGVLNARANWELVLVHWLQFLILAVVTIVGLVPPLIALGVDGSFGDRAPTDLDGAIEILADLIPTAETIAPFVAALGLTFLIWTAGFGLFCFLQGGILGTLWMGDRQAPVGDPRSWHWFRTFRMRDFMGWGRRLAWRYFWLLQLIFLLTVIWLLLPLVLLMVVFWGHENWGGIAAFGIGCGGFIPIAFGWVAIALWSQLALVAAARSESSVGSSAREGLEVLGARLGAMMLLMVLLMAAGMTMALAFAPLSIVVDLALGSGSVVAAVITTGLSMIQWLASSLVNVVFAAALVALVRSQAVITVESP